MFVFLGLLTPPRIACDRPVGIFPEFSILIEVVFFSIVMPGSESRFWLDIALTIASIMALFRSSPLLFENPFVLNGFGRSFVSRFATILKNCRD